MQKRPRLTYANIVSTLALFLALGGGAAYAASKIHSGDIAHRAVKSVNLARGAVHTSNLFKRAITSGKLGVGAVRSNQIADESVGSKQIGDGAVAPSNLEFPVFYVVSPTGGSAPVTQGPDPYPITHSTWTRSPARSRSSLVAPQRLSPTTAPAPAPASCSSRSTSTASRSAAASSRPARPRPSRWNRASGPSPRSTQLPRSPTT